MVYHLLRVYVVTALTFKNEHQQHVPDFACSPNVDLTTNVSTSVTGQFFVKPHVTALQSSSSFNVTLESIKL